jgi:hypothetical protein
MTTALIIDGSQVAHGRPRNGGRRRAEQESVAGELWRWARFLDDNVPHFVSRERALEAIREAADGQPDLLRRAAVIGRRSARVVGLPCGSAGALRLLEDAAAFAQAGRPTGDRAAGAAF